MSDSNKFGFSEKIGCSFLVIGIIILIVFHIVFTGIVKYIDLTSYLFLVIALLYLKSYSKIFIYAIIAVLSDLVLSSLSYLFLNNKEIVVYTWTSYTVRVLDFIILSLICAAINHYACKINNCELSERCIYVNKMIIWLAAVIIIYTFRIDIIHLLRIKGLGATLATGAIYLSLIMMPVYSFLQISGMIKEFKNSLRFRSYIIK